MFRSLLLVCALLGAGIGVADAQAPVYTVITTTTTTTSDVEKALALAKAARLANVNTVTTTSKTVVIPPGYHAHTRTDGSVIVHSDALMNDPVAHQGVPYPWHKSAVAGQTVTVNAAPVQTAPAPSVTKYTATSSYTQQSCPNGVCPNTRTQGLPVGSGGGWYLGKNLGR